MIVITTTRQGRQRVQVGPGGLAQEDIYDILQHLAYYSRNAAAKATALFNEHAENVGKRDLAWLYKDAQVIGDLGRVLRHLCQETS